VTDANFKEVSMWIPVLSSLVGGVIAITGNIILSYFNEKNKAKLNANSLKAALAAEIENICHLLRTRKYLDGLRAAVDSIKEDGIHRTFKARVNLNYSKIYDANLENIGLIGVDLSSKVCKFYSICSAVIEDLNALYADEYHDYGPGQMIEIYENMIGLVSSMLKLGDEIAQIVSSYEV